MVRINDRSFPLRKKASLLKLGWFDRSDNAPHRLRDRSQRKII
ncbi:hypothetical protein [Okeania sp. SIO3I5]|nr:hypothetical protein [Okeania sp. SIO3I5]